MTYNIGIGIQDFEQIRKNNGFYVDKTSFIKEWADTGDAVTLITRPRRFGKTLNMSMLNCFFSNKYAERSDLFEGLKIWEEEKYRKLQGTYPVIFVTFAGVKGKDYISSVSGIKMQIIKVCDSFSDLMDWEGIAENEKRLFNRTVDDMTETEAAYAFNTLSSLMERYYGKKVLIFLDEYDTPLQEAYVNGYWDEMTAFIRTMFNNTFKTNPSMERAVMTGITRVSKKSIFSDLNNLVVITTTSNMYETSFGFTEEEVFSSLDRYGTTTEEKESVKYWYDGFTFGKTRDIYNPWSISNYLRERKLISYWANTSANGLVGKLIREGDKKIKTEFEKLLKGECIETELDEQIIFSQLKKKQSAIWSLLLASGYLKVTEPVIFETDVRSIYKLALTNHEVKCMFERMIQGWFEEDDSFGEFITAMFKGDTRAMNRYMNKVALNTFSYFDTGKRPSKQKEPERFYHGFVLGLMVENARKYSVKSNRESGYGRYDVVMEPKDKNGIAVIMEFKVFDDEDDEKTLEDTALNALKQIEEKKYDTDLLNSGIPKENIFKYGFAFEGEKCLIKKA